MKSVLIGNVFDILPTLPAESVNCIVTSPPYWGLRDYGTEGQLGSEPTIEAFTANLVCVFREVRRVLRDDGTLWMNLGDSYAGPGYSAHNGGAAAKDPKNCPAGWSAAARGQGAMRTAGQSGIKQKDLCGVPWTVGLALRTDGWYLRSEIIWAKKNCMPESCTDRPSKSHETLFLLTKSPTYYYDADAIREPHADVSLARVKNPFHTSQNVKGRAVNQTDGDGDMTRFCHENGRNKRDVWTIATQPYPEAHFATYPEKLVEPCILAGCPTGGTVLDPFVGSGTTGAVAYRLGRKFIGIELNPEYAEMAERRIAPHRDQMQLDVTT